MGILQIFSTLQRSGITASAIKGDFNGVLNAKHFWMDFNSTVHVTSPRIVSEINSVMKDQLTLLYQNKNIQTADYVSMIKKYGAEKLDDKLKSGMDPRNLVKSYHQVFTKKKLDSIIIDSVIEDNYQMMKNMIGKDLETLMIAIDGVPSKGKLVEQTQRRTIAGFMIEYKKKLIDKHKSYLLKQKNFVYLAEAFPIDWDRTNITPGTKFMYKLNTALKSEEVKEKFVKLFPKLITYHVSGSDRVGEGEKKIVNFAEKYFHKSSDETVIYSPDADVIMLCMLLSLKNVKMLRYDQQKKNYGVVNIKLLKNNIASYLEEIIGKKLELNRIVKDIVFLDTVFGNDFVPRLETFKVGQGFEDVLQMYSNIYQKVGDYIIHYQEKHHLNLQFLRLVFQELVKKEDDYLENQDMYQRFRDYPKFRYIFPNLKLDQESLYKVNQELRSKYAKLLLDMEQEKDLSKYFADSEFMETIRKIFTNLNIGDESINTKSMNDQQFLTSLKKVQIKTGEFPYIPYTTKQYTHSIKDGRHKMDTQGYNLFKLELYRFEHMLDEYYHKLNAQPLTINVDHLEDYYAKYFGCTNYKVNGKLTKEVKSAVLDYIEGLLWVFDYYYDNKNHLSNWYYHHERAPLIRDIYQVLLLMKEESLESMRDELKKYVITDLNKFFNPVEQLMYVTPHLDHTMKIFPEEYHEILKKINMGIDPKKIAEDLINNPKSKYIDCANANYLSKCILEGASRKSREEDEEFLRKIREVTPSDVTELLMKSKFSKY